MKNASEFRSIARNALKGKWIIAVLAGIVAGILGAGDGVVGPKINLNISGGNLDADLKIAGQTIFSTAKEYSSGIVALIVGSLVYVLLAALIVAAIYFVISSVISVGYAKFRLNMIDGTDAAFENIFSYFSDWKTTACAKLLRSIYELLWTLLFIIPGIMASYSYAMTDYILADNPSLSASEAISRSKDMMYGNRWRLFCLHFSFIGWQILASLTFGIGNFWLNPYREISVAAFYREVSGTEQYVSSSDEYLLNVQED